MRLALALLVLLGCSGSHHDAPAEASRPQAARHRPGSPGTPAAITDVAELPPSTFPAAARLIAIGDVHGDLDAFQSALRAADAIDADAHWSGGGLFVVQTGDLLDRGDQERDILDFVDRVEDEASAAGGHFLVLIGNHELMNAQGDFRYVTPGGYHAFDSFAREARGPLYDAIPERARGRVVAFHPGGPYARMLATHATIVRVGDTLFLHGGALARYVESEGIDEINDAARAFFLGEASLSPALTAEDGPVWYRGFASGDDTEMCARLDDALAAAHAQRMVIGHTKQPHGISFACEGHVARIDVGLARIYDGPIEVLEITAAGTRVISGTR